MKFSDLQEVQHLINENVEYVGDLEQYGFDEMWEIADKIGDCEDYALRKLHELLKRGWPIEKLRLATCWCENNLGYHAVLWVDTEKGPYILDNRFPHIYEPDLGYMGIRYKWDKIQQVGGSKTWVKF